MTVAGFALGCASAPPNSKNAPPAATETKSTKVTKDILKARLAGKNVQFIEELAYNEKPDPLFLEVQIVRSGPDGDVDSPLQVKLNTEDKETISELSVRLNSIFKMRAEKGMFVEGKDEVGKRVDITVSESQIARYNKENIYVEDFERLIDDLHNQRIDQIAVNFAHQVREITIDDIKPGPSKTSKP